MDHLDKAGECRMRDPVEQCGCIGLNVCSMHAPDATARLIAAAPDMLEALKTILAYLPRWKDDEKTRFTIVRWAESAIAKAEGQS